MMFISYDVETTGLNAPYDRVVEIAAVKFDKDGYIIGMYSSYIDPKMPIPPDATKVHGITNNDVKGFNQKDVINEFVDFIEEPENLMVAHNSRFDSSFVGSEIWRSQDMDMHPFPAIFGERCPQHISLDSLEMSRSAFSNHRGHSLNNCLRYCGISSAHIKSQIPEEFELASRPHRAIYDAIAVKDIFLKMFRVKNLLMRGWHFHVPGIYDLPPVDARKRIEKLI